MRFRAAWYGIAYGPERDIRTAGVLVEGGGRVLLRLLPEHAAREAVFNEEAAGALAGAWDAPELFDHYVDHANAYFTDISKPFTADGPDIEYVSASLLGKLQKRLITGASSRR